MTPVKPKQLNNSYDLKKKLSTVSEDKVRLVKNGHTYKVVLTWRGKTYMIQMFVPSVSRPTRQTVEKEIQKIYPDSKVLSFLPKEFDPANPTVMVGEGKKVERDEYGDIVGGPKISKKEKAKNLASNEKDEKITRSEGLLGMLRGAQIGTKLQSINPGMATGLPIPKTTLIGAKLGSDVEDRFKKKKKKKTVEVEVEEQNITEDDMKGMSVSSGHKRPTKSGAGMTAKGVAAYRRRNPGSKLKTAVTGKVKKGSKDAKRRKSYCARSAGQMKKFPKAAKDPNSRLRQARRRWKC